MEQFSFKNTLDAPETGRESIKKVNIDFRPFSHFPVSQIFLKFFQVQGFIVMLRGCCFVKTRLPRGKYLQSVFMCSLFTQIWQMFMKLSRVMEYYEQNGNKKEETDFIFWN